MDGLNLFLTPRIGLEIELNKYINGIYKRKPMKNQYKKFNTQEKEKINLWKKSKIYQIQKTLLFSIKGPTE